MDKKINDVINNFVILAANSDKYYQTVIFDNFEIQIQKLAINTFKNFIIVTIIFQKQEHHCGVKVSFYIKRGKYKITTLRSDYQKIINFIKKNNINIDEFLINIQMEIVNNI